MTASTLNADDTASADPRGRCDDARRGPDFSNWARRGPPPPVKVLGVVVAFLIFPPLGLLAMGFLGWKAWQRHQSGETADFGPFARRGVQNSAFRAHRREVMSQLEAEARALAAHEQAEREARDRETLEAFRAAQASAQGKDGAGPAQA